MADIELDIRRCSTCGQAIVQDGAPSTGLRRLLFSVMKQAYDRQQIDDPIQPFERFRAWLAVRARWCDETFVEAPDEGWTPAAQTALVTVGRALKVKTPHVFMSFHGGGTSVRIQTAKSIANGRIGKGEFEAVADAIFDIILAEVVPGTRLSDYRFETPDLTAMARARDKRRADIAGSKAEIAA